MTSPDPAERTASLSPGVLGRLAFIRMFFDQGIDQSHRPEPLNVGSVLTMQDAVEMFLQLVAEHRGIELPRFVNFPEYWKQLAPPKASNGVVLSGERRMNRLNDLRTAFKHHGTLPSVTAVAQACTDARAFFEANTLTVFGVPFDTIDMTEVIPQAGVRDKVRAATVAATCDDLVDGMGLLAEAYDELMGVTPGPHTVSKVARFGNTISPVAEQNLAAALRPAPDDRSRRPAGADHHLVARAIAQTMRATREMQIGMRVMALGIDYPQFIRFQRLTPTIGYFVGGGSNRMVGEGYAPTDADFEFCRQFVITAALRITEAL